MGDECNCTLRVERKSFNGKAHLDSDKITFRSSEKRLSIPLVTIKSTTAKDGSLEINYPEGLAIFSLGSLAEKWAAKILHPKSLLDKLGVKPLSRVCLVNVADEDFRRQLRELGTTFAEMTGAGNYDLIFAGMETKADLQTLASLKKSLAKTGAIWVIRPKGKELSDVDVIGAAKSAGMVDVKVARFSATHSAEKLMIPLAAR